MVTPQMTMCGNDVELPEGEDEDDVSPQSSLPVVSPIQTCSSDLLTMYLVRSIYFQLAMGQVEILGGL